MLIHQSSNALISMLLVFERECYTLWCHYLHYHLMNETLSDIIDFGVSVKTVCCFRQPMIVSSNKAVL